MRILVDANIGGSIVTALRDDGHDVAWMYEDDRQMADPNILSRAVRKGRLLLTYDTDFGELTFLERLPSQCGVVLFRISRSVAEADRVQLIVHNLAAPIVWHGRFWVINIRNRSLPTQ